MKITPRKSKYTNIDVFGSVSLIMAEVPLMTIASVNSNGEPWVATVFYIVDMAEMKLYFLTSPRTKHARNYANDERVAVNIFDSSQEWTDDKKGIQLSGIIKKIEKKQKLNGIIEKYLLKYKGLEKWIADITNFETTESRFYEVDVKMLKVLDEEKFGPESWIIADIVR